MLALFLAFSETFGKASQTEALNLQIEASNLWNFMQAKTIRRTFTLVQSEAAKIEAATTPDEARKAALSQADRRVGEDRSALPLRAGGRQRQGRGNGGADAARAGEREERDLQFNKYHNFEFASAAFQIGIVLCSAAVITGIVALAWAAIGIGLIGVLFTTTGFVLPTFPHDVAHFFEAMFSKGGHH